MAREQDLYFTPLSVSGIRKINVLIYLKVCYPDTSDITSKTGGLENWLGNNGKIPGQKRMHVLTSTYCARKRGQFSTYFTLYNSLCVQISFQNEQHPFVLEIIVCLDSEEGENLMLIVILQTSAAPWPVLEHKQIT